MKSQSWLAMAERRKMHLGIDDVLVIIGIAMSKLSRTLFIGLTSLFLASCGVVIHENMERKSDDERFATLSSMSDAELCSGYNNFLVKPKTERDIERILRERKVGRCDARGKIRTIPLDIDSKTANDSLSPSMNEAKVAEPAVTLPSSINTATASISTPPQQVQKVTPPPSPPSPAIVYGNNETLVKDIEAMRKEMLAKDGFESNAEYAQRKQRYFDQFRKGKGYRITFDIDNAQNKQEKLVYFNPDTEELRIAMPSISRDLIWIDSGEKNNLKWIHYSFVQVDSTDHKLRTYKASNRLGASIDVVEMAVTRYGLAVLSQATKDYGKDFRQTFTTRIGKSEARELLEKGKISLEFVFDPRYPSNKDNPFLLKHNDTHKPTFDRPIDMTDTRYAVPVRLVKVRLLSKTGAEIFSAQGQQVDVESITD